jgi:hypothetical protein
LFPEWIHARLDEQICLCFQGGEGRSDLADCWAQTMNAPQEKQPESIPTETVAPVPGEPASPRPKEFGGRDGPEPTRFGDWEKAGRCIDF